MKTIKTNLRLPRSEDAPKELRCVATLNDIKQLRKIHKEIVNLKGVVSYDVSIQLYGTKINPNWIPNYEKVVIHIDRADSNKMIAHQHLSNAMNLFDHVVSHQIDIDKLEKYLKKYNENIPVPKDWKL